MRLPFCAIIFLQLLLIFGGCAAYKHVILMHGLFEGPDAMETLVDFITKAHPGTTVTNVDSYNKDHTLFPMWSQTNAARDIMVKAMEAHPEGVHLLCYSQGGLVCRGILESLPSHNVHNFVSLSAPQGGQFGDTAVLKYLFPHWLKENIYELFYSRPGQYVSIANYWNDPHHYDLYKKYSKFLAVINNESSTNYTTKELTRVFPRGHKYETHGLHVNHHATNWQPMLNLTAAEYKENFLKIKNLVLIGGPNDTIIMPWQSSHFGAYNDKEEIVDMKRQKWYTEDLFGLQTLDKRGAIHMHTVAGIEHHYWIRNETIFKECIEKWLT